MRSLVFLCSILMGLALIVLPATAVIGGLPEIQGQWANSQGVRAELHYCPEYPSGYALQLAIPSQPARFFYLRVTPGYSEERMEGELLPLDDSLNKGYWTWTAHPDEWLELFFSVVDQGGLMLKRARYESATICPGWFYKPS